MASIESEIEREINIMRSKIERARSSLRELEMTEENLQSLEESVAVLQSETKRLADVIRQGESID